MSRPPIECVPECVPSVSQKGPGQQRVECVPRPPSPTGGTHSASPTPPCPTSVSHTPTDTPTCGHHTTTRTGTWTCTVQGPHRVLDDGRTCHLYRKVA